MTCSRQVFRRARALCCAVFVLVVARDAVAQSKIEGAVLSAEGTPVANATVRLELPDQKQPLTTTTNAQGRYAFENVRPGVRVRLTAIADGRALAQSFPLISLWVETIDLQARLMPTVPTTAAEVFASEGPTGTLAGIVRDASGRPVAAARVLVGDTRVFAMTDAGGRYSLSNLRPGVTLPMKVNAPGFQAATRDVEVPAAQRTTADFELTAEDVTPASGAAMSVVDVSLDGASVGLRPTYVAGFPGLAPKDVFRVVQFLPGVVASTEVPGELAVRGGAADQMQVTVDGYTLYQWPSLLSSLSPFNTDVLGHAEFSPMASGARDGGRLGGALKLEGLSSTSGSGGGFVDLSVLGVGGFVNVPLGKRGSVVFGGRRNPPASYYDNVLDAFMPDYGTPVPGRAPRYAGGIMGPVVEPGFRDVNARLDLRPTTNDRITGSFYDGRDDLDVSRDQDVPVEVSSGVAAAEDFTLPTDAVLQVSDVRQQDSRGFSGSWERLWSPLASTSVGFSRSEFGWAAGRAFLLTSPSTQADYSLANRHGGSRAASDANEVRETTIRVDGRFGAGFAHTFSIGGQLSKYETTYDLRREAVRFGTDGRTLFSRLETLASDASDGQVLVGYAQDEWRATSRLLIAPGVRVARYDRTSETFVEPRANVSFQMTPRFRLIGSWSIDHQAIQRITHEDRLHGDTGFWTLSDGVKVPVARAQQGAGGFSVEVPGVVFRVEGYYKALDDLTLFAPRLFPGAAPAAKATLFHVGTGTVRGVEATVQHSANGNTVWASWAFAKSEYEFPTLETDVFPGGFDQQNEVKITDTLELIGGWSVSGAFVLGSGRPYTSAFGVDTVWFPTGYSVFHATFGAKNSSRMETYHRLDLATQKDFTFGRLRSSLGVTVFNVYNRSNTSYFEFDTANDSLTGNEVILPGRTVNVRLRVGF